MPLYDFDSSERLSSIDARPDNRLDTEKFLTKLSVYNHGNPDLAWAERSAEELINISGAIVTLFQRTDDSGSYDEVWDEDADPTYKSGAQLKGYFIPQPLEMQLLKWGVDIENKATVIFARAPLFQTLGNRMIRPGDIIESPYNSLNPIQANQDNKISKFRVTNTSDAGNFRYRWLYWRCDCELLTGDKSINIEHR